MKRLTPKQVRAIIGTTALVATLAGLDVWAAMRLVRGHLQLPVTVTLVESLCPVDDSTGGRSLVAGIIERLTRAKLTDLPPCRSDLHVPHERLLELSPFPPLLQETAASSAGPIAGSTVIDTDAQGRLQLTVVYGPSDSTPSRFVPRAPGDAAFRPNFRVTYLYLHEPGPTLEPKLRFVAWRAVEAKGDGARITALSLSFAAAEAVIVLMLFGAFLRGRRKTPTPPLPH